MEPKWKISVEKREPLRAVYAYALTETPEEDAWKKIQAWAGQKGLLAKEKGTKVFGRNTYPTDNPEPHGYELYITVDESTEADGEIIAGEISGGLYAVLKSTFLIGITHAWLSLWRWLDESEYEFIGWRKGEHGWVNGYEEYLNPFDDKTQDEWLFNLMIPIK
ncbi:GyrI-like domain-containing protein [Thermoproteota archaeon]